MIKETHRSVNLLKRHIILSCLPVRCSREGSWYAEEASGLELEGVDMEQWQRCQGKAEGGGI